MSWQFDIKQIIGKLSATHTQPTSFNSDGHEALLRRNFFFSPQNRTPQMLVVFWNTNV